MSYKTETLLAEEFHVLNSRLLWSVLNFPLLIIFNKKNVFFIAVLKYQSFIAIEFCLNISTL